jgi:hypothetical protein
MEEEKKIVKFNNLKEQEEYHFKQMIESSVKDRFRKLYLMQQMNQLFHPAVNPERKILIRPWIF